MSDIYCRSVEGALRQGEIISNLVQVLLRFESIDSDSPEADFQVHPFAIVLSQDCDLEQDWKSGQQPKGSLQPERLVPEGRTAAGPGDAPQRQLPSVLFAQMNEAAELKGRVAGSDIWKRVIKNKDERYHFLEAASQQDDSSDAGVPELGIDFKRYFTIPTDDVYRQIEKKEARRRCRLVSPYLEHLSTRFCYYQFRVALPADHQST